MTKIGDDSLVWDVNGRLITSVTASLVYNWDGKLRSATSGDDSIALKYDPMGNRVYKSSTVSSVTTKRKFIVDIYSNLPTILMEIEPDTSSLKKSYIYSGPQVLVQREHEADPSSYDDYFYLHDRLGSVRMIVDPDTAVVATYTYNPFGEDFPADCNEVVYNPFKFTGQWYDAEIGQCYLRARMYDPVLMRLTGIDPVTGNRYMPLTLHKYLYCANDPVNRTDRSGRYYSAAYVVRPIEAGYSVHYGAIAVTATGVANQNWNIIMAGLALDKMVAPVMAISMMGRPWRDRDLDMIHGVGADANANAMGNFNNSGGKIPKWMWVGFTLALLSQVDEFSEVIVGIGEWLDEFFGGFGELESAPPR